MAARKPRVGIFKFASCDGCQLSLLDCEDELLAVADRVDIVYFPEASSVMGKGPYDIAIVEGSITTPDDAQRIHDVRRRSAILVAIGACATAGGIQALRNWKDIDELMTRVYGAPHAIETLAASTPIAHHVHVDLELRGCPVNKMQLIEVVSALLNGRRPNVASHSVCLECKQRGNVCVLVARGAACLGPVTHAGCNAICPAYARGCYGCFGPMESPNTIALARRMVFDGALPGDVVRAFRTFNACADAFRRESEAHER